MGRRAEPFLDRQSGPGRGTASPPIAPFYGRIVQTIFRIYIHVPVVLGRNGPQIREMTSAAGAFVGSRLIVAPGRLLGHVGDERSRVHPRRQVADAVEGAG